MKKLQKKNAPEDERSSDVRRDIDEFTGLYTMSRFYDRAYRFIEGEEAGTLCMLAADIGHFRLFNQFYGREAGDEYLRLIAKRLRRLCRTHGGVAGYGGGDVFFYLCPDDEKIFYRIERLTRRAFRMKRLEIGFAPKFGVYRITDPEKQIMDICDASTTALAHIKGEYSRLISWYSQSMEKQDDEFRLLRSIEEGIRQGEFTFFLQPKCDMTTRKVVGSEALVRWIKKDGSLVSPGVFVPPLERNGLIARLDTIVWEGVAAWLRGCIDRGLPLLPVSVNVSRTDFLNMDVCGFFTNLVKKYEIPEGLLEVEVTESAYTGEEASLIKEIKRMKRAGFTILMDDFGSGYSSLNSLKEMDIDILKIDMKFLNLDYATMQKGVSILESIINMSNSLSMPSIIEGVETADQAKFLVEMGCIYAQGYFYYKPMKKEDFESLLTSPGRIDAEGIKLPDLGGVRLMDVAEEKNFGDEMFSNILGAVAFYELSGDAIRLVKLNSQYYKLMGIDELMTDAEYAAHLRQSIHPDDRETFRGLFGEADRNSSGALAEIRYVHADGSVRRVRMRLYALRQMRSSKLYYASLEDISGLYSRKTE